MRKLFLAIFVLGIGVSTAIFIWQSQTSLKLNAQDVSPPELQQMIEEDNDFFVYFYSPTCPECIEAEPKVAKAVQLAKVKIVKLDVKKYEDFAKQLDIPGTPTILYYNRHKIVTGITGVYATYREYIDFFQEAREKT